MIGHRVPDSTLNGKALEQGPFLALLCHRKKRIASDCPILYGDDIGSKVVSILPEVRKKRNGTYTCRGGIYTSIVIAITEARKPIPIFRTGLHHLGEILDEILKGRSKGLSPPTVVRDQSSSNKVTECETLPAGCFQHARDYFKAQEMNYPQECEGILEKIRRVFEIDRTTHRLTPVERLDVLNQSALPIMEEILKDVEGLIEAREATPSSDMGTALAYFEKYYSSFMIPYTVPGVGLTNNLSEWMTYPVVRYANNSRHYATKAGAEVGDNAMSLTMLALLSGRDPIKYFEYLFSHRLEIESDPKVAFLPWELSLTEVPEPQNNWFTYWIPQPSTC